MEKFSVRLVAAVFIQVRSRTDVWILSSRFQKKVISPCLFWRVKFWAIIHDTKASELDVMTCLSEDDQLGWWRLKSPVMIVGMFGSSRVDRRGATELSAGLYRLMTSIE